MVLEFCYAVAGVFWVVASWSKSKELTPPWLWSRTHCYIFKLTATVHLKAGVNHLV